MKKTLILIIMVIFLIVPLIGCSSTDTPNDSNEQAGDEQEETVVVPEGPDEIVISVILPLTGNEAQAAKQYEGAFEYAKWEINEQGGIYVEEFDRKIPVRYEYFDDQTDPDLTVEMMERAIAVQDVVAVMGGYPTNLVYLQSAVAEREQIPYVTCGGAGRAIFDRGFEWLFGLSTPIDYMAIATLTFIEESIDEGSLPKPVRIAMAVEDTAHGVDYAAGVLAYAGTKSDYFEVVMNEIFELYQPSYSTLLDKLAAANADVFLCDPHLEDYITMHREYVERNMYHQVISYGARGPQKAAYDALGDGGVYNIAATWWDRNSLNTASQAYVEGFIEINGFEPELTAYGYLAPQFLFKAIENAGTLDREAVKEALNKTVVENTIIAGGTVKMNEFGQAEYPMYVVQVMPGNQAEVVWPEDSSTAEKVVPIPKN